MTTSTKTSTNTATTSANAIATTIANARTLLQDVALGGATITRNGFALLGLGTVVAAAALTMHPELRDSGEMQLHSWLQERRQAVETQAQAQHTLLESSAPEQEIARAADLSGIERATATNPKELPKEQAAVAYWISKKYRVAPEPVAAMVNEAYEQGQKHKLDPTLILAVVAIESRFNPFAQSNVGAQGLMQVMTRIHTEKYDDFGGNFAAFDPVSNIRVGVSILKEYIRRTGSIEGGLKHYVGAANLESDGGYAAKVLAEHRRLKQVAGRAQATSPTTRTAGLKAEASNF